MHAERSGPPHLIRIGILLFDGFDELDAIGPWEVLRGAARAGAPFEVHLFSVPHQPRVEASHGLSIALDREAGTEFDWIVVPGGGWAQRAATGAAAEIARGVLPAFLREAHARGTGLASVCTGAMLLAAAGVTKGRPATTHHVAREALAESGASLVNERVVDDGDLVTAGGVTSGLDLALWLTERLASSDVARKVRTEIEHEGSARIQQTRG
jgi:transcriptional regulator GlxA family with amidase domain